MSALLKLVQPPPFQDEVEVDASAPANGSHSLHGALSFLSPWQPQMVRYLVDRFSRKNDRILDPSCGAGSVGLEVLLAGRRFLGCASEHSLVRLSQARLLPAEFADVVLRTQMIPWKQPVNVRGFQDPFPLFFDVDTYCELLNLKGALRSNHSEVDRFIQFIVASILHGHSVGHLSVYTSHHAALAPQAQARLNRERGQVPSYRAVGARIVKQAAQLLRDGVPSLLLKNAEKSQIAFADPRNITAAATGSIDLALVAPEQPGHTHHGLRSWLRSWWVGLELPAENIPLAASDAWVEHTNEVMLEVARTVRSGGRAVVRLGEGRLNGKRTVFAAHFREMIEACLASYWTLEGTIVERHIGSAQSQAPRSTAALKDNIRSQRAISTELLVLRRR